MINRMKILKGIKFFYVDNVLVYKNKNMNMNYIE